MDKKGKEKNCLQCQHYFVTWDPKAPKGCKAFGFKSTVLPSFLVHQSSGKECLKFEQKILAKIGQDKNK